MDIGVYNPANLDQLYLARFIFAPLIQEELLDMKDYWNNHYIRRSRYETIAGRPNILYSMPHRTNSIGYLQQIAARDFACVESYVRANIPNEYMVPPHLYHYFSVLANQVNARVSGNKWRDAINLFMLMLRLI